MSKIDQYITRLEFFIADNVDCTSMSDDDCSFYQEVRGMCYTEENT